MNSEAVLLIKRGDIFDVALEPVKGSEQGKRRPCVVIQNNIANKVSPVTIVAAITGAENVKRTYPVLVQIPGGTGGLEKNSFVQCNQIRTVDKKRLLKRRGSLPKSIIKGIDKALVISLNLKL